MLFGLPPWLSGKEQCRRQESRVGSLTQESSSGRGNGNSLQYSCPENPMDRGAWWATVHRVAESPTSLNTHTQILLKKKKIEPSICTYAKYTSILLWVFRSQIIL